MRSSEHIDGCTNGYPVGHQSRYSFRQTKMKCASADFFQAAAPISFHSYMQHHSKSKQATGKRRDSGRRAERHARSYLLGMSVLATRWRTIGGAKNAELFKAASALSLMQLTSQGFAAVKTWTAGICSPWAAATCLLPSAPSWIGRHTRSYNYQRGKPNKQERGVGPFRRPLPVFVSSPSPAPSKMPVSKSCP